MSRPVLVYQGEIQVGMAHTLSLNPWAIYFSNSRVFPRVKNFRNLRCDLRIKIVINGNPFYYGSFLAFYVPLHGNDNRTSQVFDELTKVQASQCPHIYIDPSTSTAGELCVPYFFPKDAMNVVDQDWRQMGLLRMVDLAPLQHANDGTDPINVSIFVNAENVSLSTPTINEPIENQGDEYAKPSHIAHNVAWTAGWLKDVPLIGPYMRATEVIASRLGDLAAVFGFSRAREVREASSIRNRPLSNLAVTNVPDNIASLAVDAKKEVTIDPRVVGLPPVDEMMLTPLAMRESFVARFPWGEIDGVNKHLFSMRVNPIQGIKVDDTYAITPSAFTSLPFRYWRGTMRFRFNVVASAYHRGRIKIVWDPDFSPDEAGDVYNTNYTTIVDISNDKDAVVDVGWGQNYSYLPCGGLRLPKFSTDAYTDRDEYCNGTISVYVVNGLTSPGPTASDISVLVFTSMLEDYEVAAPDASIFHSSTGLKFHPEPDTGYDPLPTNDPDPTYPGLEPVVPEPPQEEINPFKVGYGPNKPPFSAYKAAYNVNDNYTISSAASGDAWVLFPTPANGGLFVEGTLDMTTTNTNTNTIGVVISTYDSTGNTLVDSVSLTQNVSGQVVDTVNFTLNITPGATSHYLKIDTSRAHTLTSLVLTDIVQKKYDAATTPFSLGSLVNYPGVGDILEWQFANSGEVQTLTLDEVWPPGTIVHASLIGENGRILRLTPGSNYTISYSGQTGVVTTCGARPANSSQGSDPVFEIWPYNSDNLNETYKLGGLIFMAPAIQNQSEEVEKDNPSAAPEAMMADELMAPKIPGVQANNVYFGEHITSWRQMMKRYETVFKQTITNFNYRWFDALIEQSPQVALDMNRMSFIDYIKSAYVGYRGGMRIKFAVRPTAGPAQVTGMISNISDYERYSVGLFTEPNFSGSTWENINLTGALDAEIPYYSQLRFFPARLSGIRDLYRLDVPRGRQRLDANVQIRTDSELEIVCMQAAAEDFSLHFFLCTPQLIDLS